MKQQPNLVDRVGLLLALVAPGWDLAGLGVQRQIKGRAL
jgi:hypothetical protein